MKLALYRLFIAVSILGAGLACSFGTTAVTPAPTVQPVSPTTIPTITIPTVQPTAAPTTQPAAVQQNNNVPAAQNTSVQSAPIVLLLAGNSGTLGDLYSYDVTSQSVKRLTTWGYNFAPHMSPNGQWVAYLSVSQAGVTAMQAGAMNPQVYANIWLFNPNTLDAIRIADQPANGSYASGNLIGRTTEPVWSPDGNFVAWIEGDTRGERLAIYSMASKSATTYPLNLPAICCEGASRTIYWGRSGIAVVANEGTFDHTEQVVYVFSPNGQQLARSTLAADTYLEYGWAIDGSNHEYLAGVTNGEFTLVDPFSNSGNSAPGYPEMIGITAPNDLAIHPAKNLGLWTITRQGQAVTDLNNVSDVRNMSIAPDGHSLVYVTGDYFRGGSAFAYLATGQVVPINVAGRLLAVTWGATTWRIHSS